jgi:hypothetical protein
MNIMRLVAIESSSVCISRQSNHCTDTLNSNLKADIILGCQPEIARPGPEPASTTHLAKLIIKMSVHGINTNSRFVLFIGWKRSHFRFILIVFGVPANRRWTNV